MITSRMWSEKKEKSISDGHDYSAKDLVSYPVGVEVGSAQGFMRK